MITLKRSEGWVIKLREKIKNSLTAKIFLWVFFILTICSMVIYSIMMNVIPKHYQVIANDKLETNADYLFSELENVSYDDAVSMIYDFCIQNNSTAMLSGGDKSFVFGNIESDSSTILSTESYMTVIQFDEDKTDYVLSITSISDTADEISLIFMKMLPIVLGVIILISFVSAFICSKVIVRPISEMCNVSKKMAELDMTERCKIKSSDEIAVLSSNLNIMAEKLQQAEEQRRNFFAAVSHELKTPLTILKGQLENMILGYGDYKNHEKYLPETMKAAENIEYLVKEILSISKMENMNLEETTEEVSLIELLNQTIKNMQPIAKEKEIEIHQMISQDIFITVNRNLFIKALSNIIGNAVRHSPCGENVYISQNINVNKKNTLIVENTGVLIPEADLQHMFTPFYRTDKSRNKSTGGSGMGLYIVKTILDLHKMGYRIENKENSVVFYLEIN